MYLGFWSDVSMLIPITPINSKGAIPVYWLKCICRCQTRVRRTRYWGLSKTHLQNVAIAAAINLDRLAAWFDRRPRAKTRTSRFVVLAPPHAMEPS